MATGVQNPDDLAARLDLSMREGVTFGPYDVVLRGPRQAPLDLTGVVLEGEVRRRTTDAAPLDTLEIEMVDALKGHFLVSLPHARVTALAKTDKRKSPTLRLSYAIFAEDTFGVRRALLYGDIEYQLLGAAP